MSSDGEQQGGAEKVVDLEHSQNAADFDDEELFFSEEMERAVDIVEKHVEGLEGGPGELHQHESIGVFGPRGVGKTSFLLTLSRRLKKANIDVAVFEDPLDPSLIENNEVFLATVTSNIIDKVEEESDDETLREHRSTFDEALKDVASGFRVLQGEASTAQQNYNDPELIAERILRDASSGANLAESFRDFVDAARECLNVEAFVQPLDDVDTAYEHGWDVLETLRKYLSTERFITVLSGDLDLYRIIVRSEQWKHLESLVESEREVEQDSRMGREEYVEEIDRLENQYLKKLLPVRRRIRLENVVPRIHQRAQEGREYIDIRPEEAEASDNANKELSELFARFSKDLFGWPLEYGSERDRDTLNQNYWAPARLLPRNTRKIIRFIESIAEGYGLGDTSSDQNSENRDESLLKEIRKVFDHLLYKRSLRRDNLKRLASGEGFEWLANFMLNIESDSSESSIPIRNFWRLVPRFVARLKGKGEQNEWNQIALILQAHVNKAWQEYPEASIKYLFKVALPVSRYEEPPESFRAEDTKRFFRLGNREPVSVKGARATAQWLDQRRAGARFPSMGPGLMQLKQKPGYKRYMLTNLREIGDYSIDDSSAGLMVWWNTIEESIQDDDIKSLSSNDKITIYLPSLELWENRASSRANLLLDWFSTDVERPKGSASKYLSAHTGLAAAAEISERFSGIIENENTAETDNYKEEISRLDYQLNELNIPLTTTQEEELSSATDRARQKKMGPDSEDHRENWEDIKDELVPLFVKWRKILIESNLAFQSKGLMYPLPVSSLSEVFSKYKENLSGIYRGARPNKNNDRIKWSVGTIIQQWILTFYHHLSSREALHREVPFEDISIEGIVERNFRNIGYFSEYGTSLWNIIPYSLTWMSHPILLGCLSEEAYKTSQSLFCEEEAEEWKESKFEELDLPEVFGASSFPSEDQEWNEDDTIPEKCQALRRDTRNFWKDCKWKDDSMDIEFEADSFTLLSALTLIPAKKPPGGAASEEDISNASDISTPDWEEVAEDQKYDEKVRQEQDED